MRSSPSYYRRIGKRLLDILFAMVLLALCFPVLVVAAVLVRVTLGAPFVFRQTRIGRDGRRFTIHKLRSMSEARDREGRLLPSAQRMTGLGRWLRRTSLDELPELFDVLRGTMSLVGPRPLLPEHLEVFTDAQRRRLEARPGITGWAQVNGRNSMSFDEKCAMDVWYVEHVSLKLDLKILGLTIPRVLGTRGIDGPAQILTGEKQREP